MYQMQKDTKAEYVFVIDSSQSIGRDVFNGAVKDIILKMLGFIQEAGASAGVVQFGDRVRVESEVTKDIAEVEGVVKQMRFMCENTSGMANALQTAVSLGVLRAPFGVTVDCNGYYPQPRGSRLSPRGSTVDCNGYYPQPRGSSTRLSPRGSRPRRPPMVLSPRNCGGASAPRILVLVTDGMPTDGKPGNRAYWMTQEEAQKLIRDGHEIWAVGVGDLDEEQLEGIASKKRWYTFSSYEALLDTLSKSL